MVKATPAAMRCMIETGSILAVDDATESLALVGRILKEAGYVARLADSGELALSAIASNAPDLILLDIRMAGLTGLEVCRQLKACPETCAIPVILMSGLADVKDWAEGLRLGADDFISKPFQREELLCRIRTHLALRKTQSLEQEAVSLRQANVRLEVEMVRRKQAETTARDSQERLQMAVFGSGLGTWHWDLDTGSIRWSEQCASMLGVSDGSSASHDTFLKRLHPDDRVRTEQTIKRALEDRSNFECDYRVVWPDGSTHWIAAKGRVHCSPERKPIRMEGVIQDITNAKKIEQELILQQQRVRLAMDAARAGTWEWELATGKNTWSDELWKLYGLPLNHCEPSYDTWLRTVHLNDRERVERVLQETVARELDINLEWRVADVGSNDRWLMSRGGPLRNADGKMTHYLGVVMDITERKQIEAEALDSRAKLQTALASMTDAVFMSDAEGRFIDFNDAFASFHKFPNKEACGKTFAEYPEILEVFLPDGELAPVEQWAVPRALRGETASNAEFTLRRKDTGETWIGSFSFAPIRNREGNIIGSVVAGRDITEQKRADADRLRLDRQRKLALSAARMGWWHYDPETRIASWDDRYKEIFGVAECLLPNEIILARLHPDDLPGVLSAVEAALNPHDPKPYSAEYRLNHPDGSLRWIEAHGLAEFTGEGDSRRAVSFVGTVADITERKGFEEVLRQRNEELTRFVYTVSHDLKSPLVTIRTFVGFLEKDMQGQDAARISADLGYIRRAAEKMAQLLEELLELSRVGRKSNPPEEIPLQALVRDALDMVAGALAERRVQVLVCDTPVMLHGDRPRLLEVFQNLLDNAIKFMGNQADPRVSIGVEGAGNNHVLFVRDNGIGIDPRHHAKLFGLFEKLDPGTPGTGIGLALVKRIVEVHGGRIWAESAGLGLGTTFKFTLDRTKIQ